MNNEEEKQRRNEIAKELYNKYYKDEAEQTDMPRKIRRKNGKKR